MIDENAFDLPETFEEEDIDFFALITYVHIPAITLA